MQYVDGPIGREFPTHLAFASAKIEIGQRKSHMRTRRNTLYIVPRGSHRERIVVLSNVIHKVTSKSDIDVHKQ